jgi:uncharacterized protein YjbI with pentapeptide repeats
MFLRELIFAMSGKKKSVSERVKRHQLWLNDPEQGEIFIAKHSLLSGYGEYFGRNLSGIAGKNGAVIKLNLSKANLQCADFERVILEQANLSECDFSYAGMKGAYLSLSIFDNSMMRHVDFSGANLDYASFRGVELCHANFTGASLRETHFEGANLRNAVGLTDEQLKRAYISSTTKLPDILSHSPK